MVYLDGWPNDVRNISKDLLDRVISQLKQILPPLRMGNAILFILKIFRGGRPRAARDSIARYAKMSTCFGYSVIKR